MTKKETSNTMLRMPKSVKDWVASESLREGVSMNTYIVMCLMRCGAMALPKAKQPKATAK